jgi:hypothetical protein
MHAQSLLANEDDTIMCRKNIFKKPKPVELSVARVSYRLL